MMMLMCLALALAAPPTELCLRVSARTTEVVCQPHEADRDPGELDLRALAKAKNLTSLSIERHPIASLEPLRALPSISTLQLDHIPQLDLSPIAALTRLTHVVLSGLDVASLAMLAPAKTLATVRVADGSLTGLDGLKGKRLTLLTLYRMRGVGAVSLAGMSVEHVSVTDDQSELTDLRFLDGVQDLKSLYLAAPQLRSLAGLERLHGLEELSIVGAVTLTDISAITKLPKLRDLRIDGAPAIDPRPLAALKGLTSLWLTNLPLADIGWLARSPQLEVVGLDDTLVTDVSALAALTKLKRVHLARTKVHDVSMLAPLPDLMYLIIVGTPAATADTAKTIMRARPKKAAALTITWR